MAGKKKRDRLNKNIEFDSQGSLEGFLDNLEAVDDSPTVVHSIPKKSSIALLLTKVFILTTVVISSLMWFVWPEVKHSTPMVAQSYQVDGKLEQVVGRLEAIEQALKLQKSDGQDDQSTSISPNSHDVENLAKQKVEAAKLIQQKIEAAKLAQQKDEAAKLAQQKAEAAKLAQKKAEAVKLTQQKPELSKFAKMRADLEAKKQAQKEIKTEGSLKQKTTIEAKRLAKRSAEEATVALARQKSAEFAQQKSGAMPLTLNNIEVAKRTPDVVKPFQKNSEALNDAKTSSQAVETAEVGRPFVPFAGKKFYVYKVSVNIANVRSAPSPNAKVIAKLQQETRVIVLKQLGDWYQIRLRKSKRGWVYHTLLK